MVNKYSFPNGSAGVDSILAGVNQSTQIFTPIFLLSVFLIVLVGGMLSQKKRVGYADMPMWSVIASVSTLVIALPMTLIEGLINSYVLGVVIVITLISGFWLFMSRDKGDI